jgi:hypothetical protein
MKIDLFEFDGSLVEELYRILDPRLQTLESCVDPLHPEDFSGFEAIEHIYGVAAVAAQRFILSTCKQFGLDKDRAIQLGPPVGCTTKISAVYAAANYWKHSDDAPSKLHAMTKKTLEDAGVDFVSGNETTFLVGNIFDRCGYPALKDLITDLRIWTDLAIGEAQKQNQT